MYFEFVLLSFLFVTVCSYSHGKRAAQPVAKMFFFYSHQVLHSVRGYTQHFFFFECWQNSAGRLARAVFFFFAQSERRT